MKFILADQMAKPMSQEEAIQFLNLPNLLRIAMIDTRDGTPLVHPVWFYYESGKFFMSTEREGAKANSLRKNPNVYFLIDVNSGDTSGGGGPPRGVRGKGKAKVIEDPKFTYDVTERNIKRYLGSLDSDFAKGILKASAASCAVEITPEYMATWKY